MKRRRLLGHHPEPPGQAEQADPGGGGQLGALRVPVEPGDQAADTAPVVQGVGGGGHFDPGGGPGVPPGGIEVVAGGLVVVGEDGRPLVQPVGVGALDARRHPAVGSGSPVGELRAVGHLLGQGVVEHGIAAAGGAGGHHELGPPETFERLGQPALAETADLPQERPGDLPADHRHRLDERLVFRREPVEARRQRRLDRRRQHHSIRPHPQAVPAGVAPEVAVLGERPHDLFHEEGVAPGPRPDD
ncbi:MAG TPA: hypothetical protein VHL53_08985, partial [Acidimicrobiia bacterium]|nr:hypothetical protein [Acidimicrobiia bacterium]